ncbi:MAG: phosphoenolpyruvate carboxylase [Candidatus Doudnabacteria bacterium]
MKKLSRKIPATMATQHPDHAGKPYWHSSTFIPATEEAKESFLSFSELGISEYKWDWEGKLVDESVLERLLGAYYDYFKKFPIGKEKFLTFRLPNPKVQTEFRLSRALMGIASAAGLAKQVGLHSPPLFEVILPMTETAEEMVSIQEAFKEIACLRHPLNRMEKGCDVFLEIIPLFESVDIILNSTKILEKYLRLYHKKFNARPEYLRPYVARSDPALNSGIVPTILSIKVALSRYKKFEHKHNLPLFPVIGVGTLPFRGGINPQKPERFIKEYPGVRTAIIQSAFRYDFPKKMVIKAIAKLERELPKTHTVTIDKTDETALIKTIKYFEKEYQNTIAGIAPLVNRVAGFMPKRRERVQHTGLFGYSRGVGKVKLPRAISYTASLYSLGVPPELIGTGRGLAKAKKDGTLHLVEKHYTNLKHDLYFAGKFLYKPGLEELAKASPAWESIRQDVLEIESYLGHHFEAKYINEQEHQLISAKIHKALKGKKNITSLIEQSALLRKSLG